MVEWEFSFFYFIFFLKSGNHSSTAGKVMVSEHNRYSTVKRLNELFSYQFHFFFLIFKIDMCISVPVHSVASSDPVFI